MDFEKEIKLIESLNTDNESLFEIYYRLAENDQEIENLLVLFLPGNLTSISDCFVSKKINLDRKIQKYFIVHKNKPNQEIWQLNWFSIELQAI